MTTSGAGSRPVGLALGWKILGVLLIPIDLVALQVWLGASPCLGGKLDKCSTIKPEVLIVAGVLTALYLYRRHKANPKPFSWRGNPNITWEFALYLWWSLVFIGEAVPQLAGYIRGIPPGQYGFHFGLMDNPVNWIKTGQIYDLIFFGFLGIAGAIFYRYLYWPIAMIFLMATGAVVEFNLFNSAAGYFDTYNPEIDYIGTVIFLLSSWAVHFSLSFAFYSLMDRRFGRKGRRWALGIILAANLASYTYFTYMRNINPAYQMESSYAGPEVMLKETCPDQILLNGGPLVYYLNDKEYTPGDDAVVNWVNDNCPKVQKIYEEPSQ